MKRKNPKTSVRVFSYGLLPPVEGKDIYEEQLRLAHKYRNKLTEIERTRREAVDALAMTSAKVRKAAADVDKISETIETTEQEIRDTRAQKRSKKEPDSFHDLLKELRKEQKRCWAKLKSERKAYFDTKKKELKSISDTAYNCIKIVRKLPDAPYWGS